MLSEYFLQIFQTQPRLLFITVKGPGRYQKIGKISDHIRRVSDTYLIIRETNKQKDGFHFHAVVSTRKDIKPNWYRKGVHIHVQPIGDKKKRCPVIPESSEEDAFQRYGTIDVLDGDDRIIDDFFINQRLKEQAHHRLNVKYTHLSRVMHYMFKEDQVFKQYENIIFKGPGGSLEAILRTASQEAVGEEVAKSEQ